MLESPIPPSTRAIAAVLWVLCLAPAMVYSAQEPRKRRPLPFLPSVGVAFGLYFVLPIVLGAYNRYLQIELDPGMDYDFPVQVALVAWLTVLAAYFLSGELWSRIRFRRTPAAWDQSRIVFWGFMLLYGALAATGLKALFVPKAGTPAIMQFILSLQWLGIAFLTVAVRRRVLLGALVAFFAVGAGITVGIMIGKGSIAPVVQMAAVVGYALWLSGVRIRARWLLIAGAVLALAMSARGVADEFRTAAWVNEVDLSPVERARLMFTLIRKRSEVHGVLGTLIHGANTTFERSADMDLFADVVKRTPAEIPYWDGYTYKSLVGSAVPRVLWPEKPTKEIGQAFGHRYGYLRWSNVSTSINLPFLVEFYLNFSFVGVIAGMAIVGLIYRTLDELVNHPAQDLLASLVGMIILVPLLMLESDFSLTFGGLLLNGLALFCVVSVVRNSRKWTGRMPYPRYTAMGTGIVSGLRRPNRAQS